MASYSVHIECMRGSISQRMCSVGRSIVEPTLYTSSLAEELTLHLDGLSLQSHVPRTAFDVVVDLFKLLQGVFQVPNFFLSMILLA